MPSNEQPKFCKDCALYTAPDVCARPHPVSFDLVTGEARAPRHASTERTYPSQFTDSCGPEGVFWTAKP